MLSAVRRASHVTPAWTRSVRSNLAEFGVLESGDSLDPFYLSCIKTACQRRSSLTSAEVVSCFVSRVLARRAKMAAGPHRYGTSTFMSHHIQVKRVHVVICRRSLSLASTFTCVLRGWSGALFFFLTKPHDFYVAEAKQTCNNSRRQKQPAKHDVNMFKFFHFLMFFQRVTVASEDLVCTCVDVTFLVVYATIHTTQISGC